MSPHVMDHSPFGMDGDGASRNQTAPPAHLEETEEYFSLLAPQASSSTLENNHSSVEANPPVVGESATANSQTPLSPNSHRERILRQKARVQELLDHYRPGRSADPFFAFYEQQTGDMASTRSGNRGKSCIL